MSDSKRYYYLKLQEDFFSSKRIKKLRKIAGGDTYTLIYFKMQLLSVRNGGVLEYSGIEQTFAEELALDIDEEPENVAVTLSYLKSCGLIETYDNKEFLLPYAAANIGSESESAIRVRKWRSEHGKALQCNTDCNGTVTSANATVLQRNDIIDKEKEIEEDKEKDTEIENNTNDHQNDHRKTSNKAYEAEFEQVWERYPKKQGKQNALKAFIKARKEGVSLDEISDGVDRYSISVKYTDMQYVKQGSTWFTQRRWEDKYYLSQSRRDNGGKTARVAQDLRDGMDMIDAWVAENGGADEPF